MRREVTRLRDHGTPVVVPATPTERLAAIRKVVTDKQYAKIDGEMIDLFSASFIIALHDALSPENQAKYCLLPAARMAHIAYKLLWAKKGR